MKVFLGCQNHVAMIFLSLILAGCLGGQSPSTSLLNPDAAYTSGDPDLAGPRHRLVMTDAAWVLEIA